MKNSKGITLVALVITIIILLILAGVTIASLSDSGLFGKSKKSVEIYSKEEVTEKLKTMMMEYQLSKHNNKDKYNDIMVFLKEKEQDKIIDGATKVDENSTDIRIEVELDGYLFVIDENGNIKEEIQNVGPRPSIKDETILITLENGETPDVNSLKPGTKLMISFEAKFDEGELINIQPGTYSNGKVTYTTDGNEETIKFTIEGTINGEKAIRNKTISVADKYLQGYVDVFKHIQDSGKTLDDYGITCKREGRLEINYNTLYNLGMGSSTGINTNTFTLTIDYDKLTEQLGKNDFGKISAQFMQNASSNKNTYYSSVYSKIIVTYEDNTTSEVETAKTSVTMTSKTEYPYANVKFDENKKVSKIEMIMYIKDGDYGGAVGSIKNIELYKE